MTGVLKYVTLLVWALSTVVASTRTAHAQPQEALPNMLWRVAPSIVQVHVGDQWGSGFVYPTPRHVTTAYSVVNRNDDVEVVLGNGRVFRARVVAWSVADDLAILELPQNLGAAPLSLILTPPSVGVAVVLLGYPRRKDEEEEELGPRALPTPRFGNVSMMSATKVQIDVDYWKSDAGAPILSVTGEVVGVSSDVTKTRVVLDAARAERWAELAANIGRQGEFDPDPPAESSFFLGLYVSPFHSDRLHGAGGVTGYRYNWVAATLSGGFLQSDFEPASRDAFASRYELSFELYATLDIRYADQRKLCLGGGLTGIVGGEETRHITPAGDIQSEWDDRSRLHPILVLQDVESVALVSGMVELVDPAVRIDIGLVFGR